MLNSLKQVCLAANIYSVCLGHALSNEKEEIMGVLIGRVDEEAQISYISHCRILARSDKQPDRVEISPEQLLEAISYAEKLSENSDYQLRVVGWYHSHPHITVWPSHVDLKTQSVYQNMDKYFVGLIFSVFSTSTTDISNTVQFTCFQTKSQTNVSLPLSRLEIPVEIMHTNETPYQMLATLPQILSSEEQISVNGNDQDDVDEFTKLHNTAIQILRFVNISDKTSRPLIECLEHQIKIKKKELSLLKKKKKIRMQLSKIN